MRSWPIVLLTIAYATSGAASEADAGLGLLPPIGEVLETCRSAIFENPMEYRSAGTTGLAIVVNVSDACKRDWQLILTMAGNKEPALAGVIITGEGLKNQISEVLSRNPGITVEDACSQVQTRTISGGSIDQGELEKLVDRFGRMRVDPSIKAPLVLDGNLYQVWVFSTSNRAYFEFFGLPSDGGAPNVLQKWVDDLSRLAGFSCRQ